MNEIYKRFDELLKIRNVTPYKVSQATGITTTTLTNWKKGKYTPKRDKLQLIADYFEVNIDYLIYGEEKTNNFSDENALLAAKIRNDSELSRVLLKYFELSNVKKKHVVELIDLLSEG
jgi:transcriptional regulator with XRE-family HTH domain